MINQIIVMFTVTIMLVGIAALGAYVITKIVYSEKRKEPIILPKKTYTIKEGDVEITFEMFVSEPLSALEKTIETMRKAMHPDPFKRPEDK